VTRITTSSVGSGKEGWLGSVAWVTSTRGAVRAEQFVDAGPQTA
jgi:hypothetical protein